MVMSELEFIREKKEQSIQIIKEIKELREGDYVRLYNLQQRLDILKEEYNEGIL